MNLVETLIVEDMIRVQEQASDWKQAIKAGISCLVEAGKVLWVYYDAVVQAVEKNGPYFVIMPGVALPHARPTDGVIKSGFSLVTLKTPVNFGIPENDPIHTLLSFASTGADTEDIERLLGEAVTLFEDVYRLNKIAHAATMQQLHSILRVIAFEE